MSRRRKVDIDRLPSNNKTRSNKKEITPVTTGTIRTRAGGGFASKARNIGNSLFSEIVVPAIKSIIVDFFSNGVNMAMFGSDAYNKGHGSPIRRRPYNKMYGNPRRTRGYMEDRRRVPAPTDVIFEDVIFDEREDAIAVLGRMMELVGDYGVATMGDLYSLMGLTSYYTHERWGWDDLSGVGVHYTSGGYLIDFPDPIYFN